VLDVDQSVPRQLLAVFGDCPPSQRSILAHQILVLVSAHSTTDDMHHKETLDEIGPDLCTDTNMRITFHGKADLAT
jgi:hypothetical protein